MLDGAHICYLSALHVDAERVPHIHLLIGARPIYGRIVRIWEDNTGSKCVLQEAVKYAHAITQYVFRCPHCDAVDCACRPVRVPPALRSVLSLEPLGKPAAVLSVGQTERTALDAPSPPLT
jgi:hypothetical protein